MFATTLLSMLNHTTPGANVLGGGNNLMRAIQSQDGIKPFIDMTPKDPDDPPKGTLTILPICREVTVSIRIT